jgi:hypothetical protein
MTTLAETLHEARRIAFTLQPSRHRFVDQAAMLGAIAGSSRWMARHSGT